MGLFDFLQQGREHSITAEELSKRMNEESGMLVLDVRSRDEYESPTGHIRGARLLPVEELPARMKELETARDRTIVTYCHSGHRSHHAMVFLRKNGYNVINMTGGIIDWLRKGLPVERG